MVHEDRLETVLTAIEESEAAGGRRLNMMTFRRDSDCGTSACLAGWAALVAPEVAWLAPFMVRDPKHWTPETVDGFAQRWLGFTTDEADAIFYATEVQTLDELKAVIGATLADSNIDHDEDGDW